MSTKAIKVLILSFGNGINILINFCTLPYLVRSLSYIEYGSYGQVLIVLSLLQGIFTYNLNNIANIYLAQSEQNSSNVFSTLMRSSFVASLLSMLVLLILANPIGVSFENPDLAHLLLISIFNLACQIPIPILISVLIFHDKVKETASILVITNVLKIIAMLVAIQVFHSITILMVFLSIVSLIQMVLLYSVVPKCTRTISKFDSILAKEMILVATPLVISGFIERALVYVDGVMISSMLSTHQYALYRAGAIEVPFIAALYGSVAIIVMPEVAKLFALNAKQEIIELKRKSISTTVYFVYPILVFLVVFSRPLVTFYLSDKYAESALVFAIFNLSLLVRVNDYQDIIIVSKNSSFIFKAASGILVLNIILNYLLIQYVGVIGGAVSFISVLFIFAFILTNKTCSILNCKFAELINFSQIGIVLLISSIIVLPIYLIYCYFNFSVWFIIICAPFYLILAYYLNWYLKMIDQDLFLSLGQKLWFVRLFIK